ncbi:MAG: pyridoxamine kinase [Clostridiales bacterium]|jgi:pyridoxine kinase|nr:pyridoxamine kinase [Clostridiales bacterium]MDY4655254.1 pyridoxamine kinase [Eubacteriales bacterium]
MTKKRILTAQDISCIGKCSLAVALPIISACGAEAAPLPTAYLSSHTAFPDYYFRPLTEEMENSISKFVSQKVLFDGIYSGFLGERRQIKILSEAADKLRKDGAFVIIDPAMADFGELYPCFDGGFVEDMKEYIKKADVIVPNLTEAAILTDTPYKNCGYGRDYVEKIIKKLSDGKRKVVITGISFDDKKVGAYGYDGEKYFYVADKKFDGRFYGTGDIFASVLCGKLSAGDEFVPAVKAAVSFTAESIKQTVESRDRVWYGVEFEKILHKLSDDRRSEN